MDNDQLTNGTINLEQWLNRNDVFELNHSEHAYKVKKQAEDRYFAELGRKMAEELTESLKSG